jgi:DNA-binding HxlR family transcriptional regulator
MGAGYGQFCPVAKAMEILDERWTILVVRELLSGSTHFNEIRRGVPKMSPALLAKRLRSLERVGIVERTVTGRGTSYTLTASGLELRPVVEGLGAWGVRWIGDLGEQDYDPHLLFWDVRRTLPVDAWPPGRTVLAIELDDVASKVARWWVVVAGREADVCDYDPGYDVAGRMSTSLRALTEVWRGDRSWPAVLRAGDVVLDAPVDVERQIPTWLGQSAIAQAVAAAR